MIGAFSAQYKSQTCVDTFCSNSANQDKPVFVFAQGTNSWSNLKKQKQKNKTKPYQKKKKKKS